MKLNTATQVAAKFTHEGARAANVNAEQQLRRTVMACLLWEDSFYEDGQSVADRISQLVPLVKAEKVAAIVIEARDKMKLRHVPLLLCCELAKHKTHRHVVAETLAHVIQRPDELTEVLAIYSRGRGQNKKLNKLSKQVQRGIATAFKKFDEYSLAKYNQDGAIKLRDALFLSHAKPEDRKQAQLWKRLVNGDLKTPDTWEVALSATQDKKVEWTRLLVEEKLGALALLRNLRNMTQAGVDRALIIESLLAMKTERVLPFRFISAAQHAPVLEPAIEQAMLNSLEKVEKLPGRTVIVVDNSGSMNGPKVSAKSEIDRSDAACALAILLREICEDVVIIGFGNTAGVIPARRGFALRDAIKNGPGGGTYTEVALTLARQQKYDRIIVITDEQSHQTVSAPLAGTNGYFINVATYQNGIGYGPWTHIDGFSESVIEYIRQAES